MFNAVRQLGGAVGVAVLTTVIVLVGPVHLVGGHEVANLTAYRVAFLAAAAICLCAVACSLSIRDADAASTIPRRGGAAASERAAGSLLRRPDRAASRSRPATAAGSQRPQVEDGGAVRLRAAGQALGRPGAAVVQVRVVLPGEPDPAEQVDGGFGHGAVGLAGPQGGDVGRHRGLVGAVRGRHRGVLAAAETAWNSASMSTQACATRREGAVRLPELLAVLGVGDGRVQAPADAADGLGGGGEQEVMFGLFQGGGRDLALAEQHGRGLVEGGDADPPGQVQAQLPGGGEPQGPDSARNMARPDSVIGRHHDDVGHVGGEDEPPVAVEPPAASPRPPPSPRH